MPAKKDKDKEESQQFTDRTAEEVAWDREFKDDQPPSLASDLNNMVEFVVKLPGALLSSIVPDETIRHSRAAVRESFLAVRSLLSAVGDGIEGMLAEPGPAASETATVQGPPGTWGTGRTTQPSSPSSKTRRIEVAE